MNKLEQKDVVRDIKGTHLLPKGITLADLNELWQTAESEYATVLRRMTLLDAADNGEIWDWIAKQFPDYQIAPETNHVNFVKTNIMSSVYAVGKSANLIPNRQEDVETVQLINSVLDRIWDILEVSKYQMEAGERAALLNLGITQVGWNHGMIGGATQYWYKGDVAFKNIDPICFRRDPFATNLDDGTFCGYYDYLPKSILKATPLYAARMKEILASDLELTNTSSVEYNRPVSSPGTSKDYHKVIYMWVRVPVTDDKGEQTGTQIHEIHTLDNAYILYVKEGIQPNLYPFAELYCNQPVKSPVGVSEPARIFQSSLVVNLLDGLMATHAYKAQRPPRLISTASGLNARNFAKYGNDPDKVFLVNGRPDDVVKYVQFPSLPPEIPGLAERLDRNIKLVTGISDAYTGNDTGSITTTGGIESMLAQATARDVNKINNYESYARRLTRLVISNLVQHADKRSYTIQDSLDSELYHTVELDFPEMSKDMMLSYAIHISNDLPKNKQRMSAMANMLIEKSMQYAAAGQPPLLTNEEWLQMSDIPIKDLILQRLKLERENNATTEITETLFMFAGLIEKGVPPEQAIQMIVQQKEAPAAGGKLGNTGLPAGGLAGSPQAKQMG